MPTGKVKWFDTRKKMDSLLRMTMGMHYLLKTLMIKFIEKIKWLNMKRARELREKTFSVFNRMIGIMKGLKK